MKNTDIFSNVKLKPTTAIESELRKLESKYRTAESGVRVNLDSLRKFFGRKQAQVLQKQYDVLTKVADTLCQHSPVWSGFLVGNWNINPNSPAAATNESRMAEQAAISKSGAQNRKAKISDEEAQAARDAKSAEMQDRIKMSLTTDQTLGMTSSKNTWYFTNTTPYFSECESKHGMVEAAKVVLEEE